MANAKHQHVNAGQETYPLHERQQPQKGSETRMEGTHHTTATVEDSTQQHARLRATNKKKNTALSHLCRLKGVGKGVLIGIPPLVPPPGSPSPSDRSPQPKRHKSRGAALLESPQLGSPKSRLFSLADLCYSYSIECVIHSYTSL